MPSRAAAPSHLDLAGSGESSHRRQDSFGSYFSDKSDKEKDSRDSTGSGQFEDYRRMLGGHSTPTRKSTSSPKPHSPTVNVYTHCGRHTDQYLFSGWSNVVKSPFKKH
ncbi:hypothetical protein F4821DRAFT_225598 [Hypoxylon rubiginosum]|uniref:Uncharacterized protein n=1 Tax=Hypoxylon rubiginosum TaxID=110542 RepID=A0ACC0DG04_9PEZI|nr:hypothetical protein F4821DRAFT_225598 [Hypoxylon rubiginosum]